MKLFAKTCILFNLIFADSGIFNFDEMNQKQIVRGLSLWVSNVPRIDPISANRFYLQSGMTSLINNGEVNLLKYPDFCMGLKATKNLAVTIKSYGFSNQQYNPFIMGAGIQIYSGDNEDSLDWVTSIQRTDLIGLKQFKMTSQSIDLQKWISQDFYKACIGMGVNIFDMKSLSNDTTLSKSLNGQINYFSLEFTVPVLETFVGISLRISSNQILNRISVQKEFF